MVRTELKFDNHTIELFTYGNGPKKMLVFHGFDNEALEFQPLSTFLPEYTIISVNLFFHGNSSSTIDEVEKGMDEDGFLRLHQFLMSKFPSVSYDVLGYSLGGRIALSFYQHFHQRVDRLILLASDGLKPTTMYRFVTRNYIGKKLFGKVLKDPSRLLSFTTFLCKIKLLDEKKIRFLKYNLETALRREKVYNTWMIYRFIIPNISKIKKLINTGETRVDLFFGKFDVLMPPALGSKFKKSLGENCKVHVLQTGHQLISEKNLKEVAFVVRG